ncbi:MAG: autotransporter-associated beta strand repeat-containing protein [Gammaproteobacteria bacterium]
MVRIDLLANNRAPVNIVSAFEATPSWSKHSGGRLRRTVLGVHRNFGLLAATALPMALLSLAHGQTTFVDLSGGLTGWTTLGTVIVENTTDAFDINGTPYSLTPSSGQSMAKIDPAGAAAGSVNALLGLSSNSIESLLNNSNGSATNFGVLTKSFTFAAGTYEFAWAYAAQDYVPYNDGVFFSVVGAGDQTLVSLARNGSSSSDTSGPSPGTLVLGSYGTLPWQTTTFTVATAGTYQVSFADYNWNDESLDPILYVSGSVGTYSGIPPVITGTTIIGTTGGDVSASVFDTSSTAYGQAVLTFDGGTLQYGADTTTSANATFTSNGGTIETQTYQVSYTGSLSGVGGLTDAGTGTLSLSAVNTYTGATSINSGATLALIGSGSIAASSGISDDGTFDISGTTAGASVQSLSGAAGGTVILGGQTLTLTNAAGLFSGSVNGTGGVTVNGGSETLSGTNGYTGATAIGGGATLTLNGLGSIAASTGIVDNGVLDIAGAHAGASVRSLTGGGAVALGNQTLTLTNALGAFTGSISGSGGVSVSGGTQILSGLLGYKGATSIGAGGTLALRGASDMSTSSGVTDNGSFDISGTTAGALVHTLRGAGTVLLGNQTLVLTNANDTFAGAIRGSGSVDLTGGTEALTGASTYTGGTTVSGGSKLLIASGAALGASSGTLTLDNSTLENTASITLAHNLNVTGAATLVNDPGKSLQLNGSISGTAAITKTGDGILVLAGDDRTWGFPGNNTDGGLTIDGGLVKVTNAHGLGYGPIVVNSGAIATTVNIETGQSIHINGDTVFNTGLDTTTTLSGTVVTGGTGSCFEKTGAGALVMSGTAQLSNGMCVEEGQLKAEGVLTSSVIVEQAGNLRGTGTIFGPVLVHGVLAPGNSPGTLTVAGTVAMTPGSTYQVDINGTGSGTGQGNYSRLLVTGPANKFIASGTLNANLLNITGAAAYTPYVPKLGDTFRIVTADDGIVGAFSTFDQPAGLAPGTRLAIFYDPHGNNSIDLRTLPVSYATLASTGINGNARAVGGALDGVLAAEQSGDGTVVQKDLAYEVSGLTIKELPQAMTALAGEVHADLAAIAPQANEWLQSSVERQLESGGNTDDMGALEPGHSLWFDSSASYGKWSSDAQASGFSADRSQVALGIELLAGHHNRVGVGFSHSLADVSTPIASGSVEADSGFVYGQYALGASILDGMLTAGGTRWQTTRADPLEMVRQDLQTSEDGTSSLVSAGVRWPMQFGGMMVQPYSRALWQRSSRSSFDEGTAQDALSGPSYAATGVRTLAGLTAGSANGSPLSAAYTFRADLRLGRDNGGLVHPSVAAALAMDNFSINAPHVGRMFTQLNLTGTARLGNHAYAFLGASDEARSGTSRQESVNLGARANF